MMTCEHCLATIRYGVVVTWATWATGLGPQQAGPLCDGCMAALDKSLAARLTQAAETVSIRRCGGAMTATLSEKHACLK